MSCYRVYLLLRNRVFIYPALIFSIIAVTTLTGCDREERMQEVWKTVKPGMKLYVDSVDMRDSALSYIPTYRRIRPMNADDIEAMHIPEWKKTKLLTQLDTSPTHRPMMIPGDLSINGDDMFKQQTAYIGEYVKSDSLTAEIPPPPQLKWRRVALNAPRRLAVRQLTTLPKKWYAIKINKRLATQSSLLTEFPSSYIYTDDYYHEDKERSYRIRRAHTIKTEKTELKAIYVYADEYYYIDPAGVGLIEFPIFAKKKKTGESGKW